MGTLEAEEQFDGVDTDTIEAMRVGKSPSRAGNSRFQKGTFCILLEMKQSDMKTQELMAIFLGQIIKVIQSNSFEAFNP